MQVHWLEQSTADVSDRDDWLSSIERRLCSEMSFAKRRTDWRLGRWTAKHAVAAYLRLSCDPQTLAAIEVRPDASGAPDVFLNQQSANVALSLSHRAGMAVCAVAPSGVALGCDLELVELRIAAFVADYFTAEEQAIITRSATPERDRLVTVLWSAKESALKALRTGLRSDTRCVSARLGDARPEATQAAPECSSLSSRGSHAMENWSPLAVSHANGQVFQGWWRCMDGLVRTVLSLPPSNPPILLVTPELPNARKRQ